MYVSWRRVGGAVAVRWIEVVLTRLSQSTTRFRGFALTRDFTL
jgi:hypothetical protein